MNYIVKQVIDEKKHKKISHWRSRLFIVGLIVGSGFFIYQLGIGLHSVINGKADNLKPVPVVISILLSIFITFLQMNIWKILMKEIQIDIPLKKVIQGYELSFLPRYIPGSVWGYFSRVEWMAQEHNVSPSLTNLGSILEIMLIVIGNLSWSVYYFFSDQLLGLLLPFIAPIFSTGILYLIKKINGSFTLIPGQMKNSINGIKLFSWLKLSIYIVIFWALQGVALYLVILSMDNTINFPTFSMFTLYDLTSKYCFSWLVGFLVIFIPAGLGLRETLLSNILVNELTYSMGIASIISVIFRLVLSVGEIFWIVIGLWKYKSKGYSDKIGN